MTNNRQQDALTLIDAASAPACTMSEPATMEVACHD